MYDLTLVTNVVLNLINTVCATICYLFCIEHAKMPANTLNEYQRRRLRALSSHKYVSESCVEHPLIVGHVLYVYIINITLL